MSAGQSGARKDGAPRRRRQLVIREKNISSDEFMAASIGDVEWLDQSLRDGRNPSSFDKNGLAPIHLAALHGRLNCLKLLVEKYEVDVNLSSSTGWNALHLCINRESGPRGIRCMNYLLEQEADVDCLNDDNVTPVHQAASEGLIECIKTLLDHGVDLSVADVRGHLPINLAKLWGHKSSARLIRNEMWKREKEQKTEELKQLKVVKEYYSELQKEAVLQLKNEQEFYGGVAFGNWLADKNLPENLKDLGTFPRERYPEETTEGLSKRLRTSGGLDDCAQRMEKTTSRQEQRAEQRIEKTMSRQEQKTEQRISKASSVVASKTKPNSRPAAVKEKVASTTQQKASSYRTQPTPQTQQGVKVGKISRNSYPTKHVERFEKVIEEEDYSRQEIWIGNKTITPYSETSCVTERHAGRVPWNYSTNPNREPITNIKHKDTVALSIHPDEMELVLPKNANLTVKLDMTKKPKIKVMMPGGRIQSADIRMPHLPSNLIGDFLSGFSSDRIRIPQEFKAVHVYDLKKKRQPNSKPKDEVGMHLSILGDPRILRKSTSTMSSCTRSPLRTFSSSDENSFPSINGNNYSRMLDTLHRMNPPKAFLA